MGLILGIGFPPFRGGLLRWADSLGPDKILTWRVFITEPPHRDKTL